MDRPLIEGDRLYAIAESLAEDFSLFPTVRRNDRLPGLFARSQIAQRTRRLADLDIDSYIERVVTPAENKTRTPAPEVIRQLGSVEKEELSGPFYSATLALDCNGSPRLVGFIGQNRASDNGIWGPAHHLRAADYLTEFAKRRIPVVTFMDTPGADAREDANRNNQAHSISRLIAEVSNVDVPNVGIIYGLGYSGGAIPLATSNMILSVSDGVFSTIQPPGLANIARRLNLSWQECAKFVGLSPFELYMQGYIDGVIDYSPEEPEKLANLRLAIVGGLLSVEERTRQFVAESPYIMEHYRQSLRRFMNPSPQLKLMQDSALLQVVQNPTEYHNVFGVAFRYLRYLQARRRIRATSTHEYGRLAVRDLPQGELAHRADQERRRTFLKWLQDPDKVVYDDALAKAVRGYREAKQSLHDERGRIAQLIFGEPRKNYGQSRARLVSTVGTFLYNRWKGDAASNLRALAGFLQAPGDTYEILRVQDIGDPFKLIRAIRRDTALVGAMRERFTHEGKKLLRTGATREKSASWLAMQLTTELNLAVTGPGLADGVAAELPSELAVLAARGASDIRINRAILAWRYAEFIQPARPGGGLVAFNDMTVLDVLIDADLRQDCIDECAKLLLFDSVYDHIIAHLDLIAEEAQEGQSLSRKTLRTLIDSALAAAPATADDASAGADQRPRQRFFQWYRRLGRVPKGTEFFRTVEEWKRASFPHLAEALFVVVTYLFQHLLRSLIQSEREHKTYNGRIAPKNIGRRKDFWYQLNRAYRDLLMQKVLNRYKREQRFTYQDILREFFTGWEERFDDLISSDPCHFPGFRHAIEDALNKGLPPCGIVTGMARFKGAVSQGERADGSAQKDGIQSQRRHLAQDELGDAAADAESVPDHADSEVRCGVVLSNVGFQAGAFDMASGEKFCKLLVECALEHLPVVCFVCSGGMQTKEGAGALFSMSAVNDRITRFVRDHDLPLIVFGYGDCTGGAQASFVTHPLVQTYYFSGTSMPFAGQLVVPSNLPLNAILANYLSVQEAAMQGLVKHPFHADLDAELRRIDPEIPIAEETVPEVMRRVLSGVLIGKRSVATAPRPRFADADLLKPVERVLIHARGCTAAKLVRIAQARDIEVVLVQSDPDMESAVVDSLTERDSLVCIGGNTPDESYLNGRSVLSVAEQEGVDALHPGIGFLSENAHFAELVRSRGINFIGPPVSAMETMGNKSNAIATAARLKVPVVPGSHGILTDADRAAEVAADIGYPVLIKAVHGGGGKGIQAVQTPGEFHELFHRVTAEARGAFGNGDVYLEKYVSSLRHIEVQILRDTKGNTRVLGLRDCSVQRDKQKVFEESGSTMLPERLQRDALAHAAALADEVGYIGAGTVEFIFDLKAEALYFMEMNTRLQVEHPVTEWVSGVDIVGEQFRIASGASIARLKPKNAGYAIEARVNAERVQMTGAGTLAFRPHPGEITEAYFPEEADVEVIAAAATGKFVSPYYDSMVAQVIVHAADRDAAIAKLSRYLGRVRIKGICTNIELLRLILADAQFQGGEYDTNYLPELLARTDAQTLIEAIETAAGDQASAIDLDTIRIDDSDELKVLSPAAAIFYAAPSPGEPDYAAVGDRVAVDRTLCQLEAMKIFTPLALKDFNTDQALYDPRAEFEITRVNISSGQQVNAGDLLFVVKPLGGASVSEP